MAKKPARKGGKSQARRSNQKILNAFEIAERQANQSNSEDDFSGDDDDLDVIDGVMNANKLAGKKRDDDLNDEEIDSDEALGSDDDYDVLNSKFSQTIRDTAKKQKLKQKRRNKGEDVSDSDEEEDGYSSIDESELVPLSQAWDMDDNDLQEAKYSGTDIVLDDNWESEESQESDSDISSGSNSGSEVEEQNDSSDADIFENDEEEEEDIDLVNTVTRLNAALKKAPKERRRLLTETQEESEYGVPNNGKKLSLNDMISAVDSTVSKDAILLNQEETKGKALATPLPKRIQQRHERKVAYDITKEEVGKWEEIIQQNRRAEVLKFPMNPSVKHNDTANTFRSDNTPTTDMEKRIHSVLEESALTDDKKEATFEELAVANISPEELKKRTNELRMMRELMFRDEVRSRRIKKIKSKAFRKIKKKERMREEELVEGSDDSDKEDHDMRRARERMSLKHKTQSKWAKSMIKSGLTKDASNRQELEEMLRQGEKLRSKQLGYEDGEQSDDGASDIEHQYENDDGEKDNQLKTSLGKGVLAMDFMKAADARQKQSNLDELELLKKLENGEDTQEFKEDANSVSVVKNQGRRVYTPSASALKHDVNEMNQKVVEEIEDDEASNLVNRLNNKKGKITSSQIDSQQQSKTSNSIANAGGEIEEVTKNTSNPWLSTGEFKKSSRLHEVDKDSSRLAKAAQKISKRRKRALHGTEEDIDVVQTLSLTVEDSEDDTFKQQDLIKEAFAGDDVTTEFEVEKKAVIRDEDDREEDLTLPGWGDWAGGNKKSKKRKIVRKINGVVQMDKRRDKNKKNVIINEKVNKKNLKYQSSDVPYPYESREQYERALRMPVGQEWTSRETHQKLTMPRIVTKQGTVIDPLKAPFK